MASPHPVPQHIKQLRGTDRADRKASNPVVWTDIEGLPDIPDFIGTMDKRTVLYRDLVNFWQALVMDIHRLNLLSRIGIAQIEGYVFDYRVWRENVDKYNNGDEDCYKTIMEARKAMQRIEDRWGFNPSYQQKINWPVEESTELDEFGF